MDVDIADNDSQDSDEEDEDLERADMNGEVEEASCPVAGGDAVTRNPEPVEEDDQRKSKKFWKKEKKSGGISFDRNLPSAHSYLGNDMEEVQSGRTIHDDDSYVEIPIYLLPGIVLIPDQVIPLHLFQPQMVAMMKSVAEKDKTFGVMTFRNQFSEDRDELDVYGTTAEIFSMKDETDDISGISTLRIKARGRQRFQLIESHRDITGVLRAKVKIMAEKILPGNLEGARPQSHVKLCCAPPLTSRGQRGRKAGRTLSPLSCANYTWWPYWVYKMFDTEYLFEEIMRELRSWNDSLNEDSIPRTATELSFWLAQNLPLDDTIRLRLISYDSAIQRLRYELVVMKTCTVLQCKYCKTAIANKNDVFSMAVEGPMGAFVNPAGHVHETLTISQAKNLHVIGDFSTEHSWFPGYAWQIAQCKICGNHMGWKFKTEKKKKLSPPKFWGLCRSSLIPGMQSDDNQEKMHYMH